MPVEAENGRGPRIDHGAWELREKGHTVSRIAFAFGLLSSNFYSFRIFWWISA